MAKNNVIPILPRRYEVALAEFKQTCRLESFLDALSALGETTLVDSRLQEAWSEIGEKAISTSPLNEVLDWYALHDIHKSLGNGETATNLAPPKAICEFVEMVTSKSRYYEAKAESPDNPYGRILVALNLGEFLTECFGDDDPALCLVRFIRALFLASPVQPTKHKVIRNGGVKHFIQQTLVPWALDAEKTRCEKQKESDNKTESLVADCRLDQLAELAGVLDRLLTAISIPNNGDVRQIELSNLRDIVVILPYLPQRAFERTVKFLVAAYGESDILDSPGNGFGLFLDLLTSLPLGEPFRKGSAWVEAEQIPANSYLKSIAINIYPDDRYPYLPVPFLYQIFDLIDSTRGYILDDVSEPRDFDYGGMTIPVLRERIHVLLRKTTSLRRRHPHLLLDVSTEGWSSINYSLKSIAGYLEIDPEYDPLMRLALDFGAASDSFFSPISSTEESESRGVSFFDDLANTYRAVVAEGWYEVGTACLALFLVTQPLRCAGRLYADWSRLGPMLLETSQLPGGHRVKVAVSFAMHYCKEKNGDTLDVLALHGWSDTEQGKPIIGQPSQAELNIDRRQIEKDLKKDVGTENWLKIRPETIVQLVDAEALWTAIHREVGRGQQDFGSIANAFVKALEGELGHHLGPILGSPTYQSWKGSFDKNVTLGPMLHLFRKFSTLPEELSALVEATGVSIQTKPKLIQQLLMANELRNKGSHPGPFSDADLSKLRSLLFENGLLRQFLDALPPDTTRT